MKIVLSTRNPSKMEQIKEVFALSPVTVLDLDDVGVEGQGIEDGETLEHNALKKALFVHEHRPDLWAMADDTGIFIDALDGKPGVHTAGWTGGNEDTERWTEWILEQLKEKDDRSATFETVVAIISPEGSRHLFAGKVHGVLLREPKTKPQRRMPYSPIFVPDGHNKVWAEMTLAEENSISHRGKAFRKARAFLESVKS